jgi:signal transduction histidine kinase
VLCDEPTPELLARSVIHELRQSLSLIVGYAELLARAPDELTRAELLGEIRRAAARLAGSLAKLEHAEALETVAFGALEEYRVLDLRV